MTAQAARAPSVGDRRQRRVLIGLALMFFAPLVIAFYLYYGHATWLPGGHVNAGELVEPPRPLPPLALPLMGSGTTDPNFLKGKWTLLLYAGTGPCAESCRRRLYDTRQVRLALNRDMDRVQRVFIGDGNCCDAQFLREQHPDLIGIRAGAAAATLVALLPGRGGPTAEATSGAAEDSGVFLVDPLGNLMMSYPAGVKPKGMLEDMKRLLRLSSIG